MPGDEWPDEPHIVERVSLRSCARRGAAIDVVADRGREQRSQIVFTNARGREMVFWQSPRTRKQARPDVRLPTARAAGVADLEIVVDAHEKYAYRFDTQQVRTVQRGLPYGDYAVSVGGKLIAAVERKSLGDLVSSLISGRLRFALGELGAHAWGPPSQVATRRDCQRIAKRGPKRGDAQVTNPMTRALLARSEGFEPPTF